MYGMSEFQPPVLKRRCYTLLWELPGQGGDLLITWREARAGALGSSDRKCSQLLADTERFEKRR